MLNAAHCSVSLSGAEKHRLRARCVHEVPWPSPHDRALGRVENGHRRARDRRANLMMRTADGDRAARVARTPHLRSEHPQASPCHGRIGSCDTRAPWRLYRLCAAFGRETRRASEPRERARTIGARSECLARDIPSMNPPLVTRSAVKRLLSRSTTCRAKPS